MRNEAEYKYNQPGILIQILNNMSAMKNFLNKTVFMKNTIYINLSFR